MKFYLKYLVLFFFCSFLLFACKQNKQTVSLTYFQPYCGGARPTEEMEKDAATPKPYTSKKIILVSENGKVSNCETDDKGNLNLKLKDGVYKLYEPWKFNKTAPDGSDLKKFDPNCINNEWSKEFCIIEIKGNKAQMKEVYPLINFCEHDLPCLIESHKPPMRE